MKYEQKSKSHIFLIIIAVAFLAFVAWFLLSPTPSAFIVRLVFESDNYTKRVAMEELTKNSTVRVVSDISYQDTDSRSKLDVYIPQETTGNNVPLPVIIWTHGGGWLSGDKADPAPYFKLLADKGFVVVAPNYTLTPGQKYPYQLHQLNAAHKFIIDHASDYNIDPSKIVLAGSSAGAQISAQFAALITDPAYALEVDIVPAIQPNQMAATVLYCGIYDFQTFARRDNISNWVIHWGVGVTTWSLFGSRSSEDALLSQASPLHNLTSAFPPTFISGGNADPLTTSQSVPFSNKLQTLGVDTITLYYPDDHEPRHPHDNQFILDEDGLANLQSMTDFLRTRLANSHAVAFPEG